MKTSKKIIVSVLLTIVCLLAFFGFICLFEWIGSVSKIAQLVTFLVLITVFLFSYIYSEVSKRDDDFDDKDDDDDDDDNDPGERIELGKIKPNSHCEDYLFVKKDDDVQPFERRLIEEWEQLDARIQKLDAFLKNPSVLEDVHPFELRMKRLALMFAQRKAMSTYFIVLTMRLTDLGLIQEMEKNEE